MKREKRKPAEKQTEYQVTESERVTLLKQIERVDGELPSPRMKVEMNGDVQTVSFDHANALVALGLVKEALGTAYRDFSGGIINQLVSAATFKAKSTSANLIFCFRSSKE